MTKAVVSEKKNIRTLLNKILVINLRNLFARLLDNKLDASDSEGKFINFFLIKNLF